MVLVILWPDGDDSKVRHKRISSVPGLIQADFDFWQVGGLNFQRRQFFIDILKLEIFNVFNVLNFKFQEENTNQQV